jgi:hypothetical protein
MYIVISKPKRRSQACGVSQVIVVSSRVSELLDQRRIPAPVRNAEPLLNANYPHPRASVAAAIVNARSRFS